MADKPMPDKPTAERKPRAAPAAVARFAGQAVLYGLFAVAIGYFSDSPAYTHFDPGQALIKISLSQVGARKGECRERAIAANVPRTQASRRALLECPRERLPVLVEVMVDGALAFRQERPPSGWSKDGPSRFYHRIAVAAGSHRIVARLRDSARDAGFDYVAEATPDLAPAQVFIVDFRAETGGFILR